MKKILIAFIFIGIFIILFYACNKDGEVNNKSQNLNEQSFKDAQLEKRIIAFRDKIDLIRENPSLKSGTDPMEIDSAVWYIESISNLTYGDASYDSEVFVVDSAFIEIPITNGQILLADVQIAYDQVIDSLSAHNDVITANDKQLIVADISLKETTDNTTTFEVTSGFGTDGTSVLGNDYPWYCSEEMGRCDGSGIGVGYDATDKIAQLANLLVPVPSGNAYYNNVNIEEDIYPDDVPTNSNPYGYGEYLLFFGGYMPPNYICMSTDEIAYYRDGLIQVGVIYKPTGKSVIRYYLDWTITVGPTYIYVAHIADIKYAVWHTSGNPPEEL